MLCGKQRESLEPVSLMILRITVGVIMAVHGWMKLTNLETVMGHFEKMGLPFPALSTYLATAGEFLGGLGLVVGLLTPIAAFGVFCTMTVAVLAVHIKNGLLASNNGCEYPLTLMVTAFYFMMKGAGPYSLDAIIAKKCPSCK
jgi:putative oxidoreductase